VGSARRSTRCSPPARCANRRLGGGGARARASGRAASAAGDGGGVHHRVSTRSPSSHHTAHVVACGLSAIAPSGDVTYSSLHPHTPRFRSASASRPSRTMPTMSLPALAPLVTSCPRRAGVGRGGTCSATSAGDVGRGLHRTTALICVAIMGVDGPALLCPTVAAAPNAETAAATHGLVHNTLKRMTTPTKRAKKRP